MNDAMKKWREWTKERHEACKARYAAVGPTRAVFHVPWGQPFEGNDITYSDGGPHVWNGQIESHSDPNLAPFEWHMAAIVNSHEEGEFFAEAHRDIPDMLAEIERLQTIVRARGELDLDFWTDVFAETGEELDGKTVRFASKRRPKQALNLIGDAIKGARGRAKK